MSEYVMVPREPTEAMCRAGNDWTLGPHDTQGCYAAMLAAAPTPPAGEAVAEALSAAVSAIYFDDSSDYLRALWSVVRAIDPAMADLLERDPKAAFDAVHSEAPPAPPVDAALDLIESRAEELRQAVGWANGKLHDEIGWYADEHTKPVDAALEALDAAIQARRQQGEKA